MRPEACAPSARGPEESWGPGLALLAARQVLHEIGEHAADAESALRRALESRLDQVRKTLVLPASPEAPDASAEANAMHEAWPPLSPSCVPSVHRDRNSARPLAAQRSSGPRMGVQAGSPKKTR